MTRKQAIVDTTLGSTKISVVECDHCGVQSALQDSWYPNEGWYCLSRQELKDGPLKSKSKIDTDYCSTDCLIRELAPGIYDTDPIVVQQTIAKLKRTEMELRRDQPA